MEPKTQKALKAVTDALQHLSTVPDLAYLEFNHIDQLLARLVDLPTDSKQKNSRRNLQLIRQWMLEDGSGIVLLEVLGGVYWRLGDLNEEQFRVLRELLYKEQTYVEVLRGKQAADIILQRIKYVQENKYRACEEFIESLKSSDVKFATFRKQLFDSPSPQQIATPDSMLYQLDDPGLLTPPTEMDSFSFMSYHHLATNEIERELIDNYVYSILPTRTVLVASNPYFKLLEYAASHESTRFAILSLSASYLKTTDHPDIHSQKYHEADNFYTTAALRALMQELTSPVAAEACFLAGMLLIHHSIVNEAELGACWSCHFNMLNIFPEPQLLINSDAAVFMSHQMILAQTAQSKQQITATNVRSMDWLVGCTVEESTRLSGATGVPRRLTYLISRINSAIISRDLTCIESLQQSLEYEITPTTWTPEVTGEALQVALDTAETYRLAALIYLHSRCSGLTPWHPTIIQFHQELYTRLLSLPTSGPLFTSTYPVWPFFIAAATGSPALRKSLYERFPRPVVSTTNLSANSDRGTLTSTLQTIGACHTYLAGEKSKAQRKRGWWEEMVGVSALKERTTMLCLGIAM